MFFYYLKLGWLSIRRNPLLSMLMIAAIAVGIGASMTTITVNYLMGADPIPHKSDQLFYVQLDNGDPHNEDEDGFEPPDQVAYLDAMALIDGAPAFRQTASFKSGMVIEPDGDDEMPMRVGTRNTYADFFSMFDVPFTFGSGWDGSADEGREKVVVLDRETNEQLFGGENSVGRTVTMNGMEFRIVGVLDSFSPVPLFYDITNGPFNSPQDVFIPFSTAVELQLGRNGNTSCWKSTDGETFEAFLNSECVWIQFWAELRDAEEKQQYMVWLNSYVEQQKELGRFERPLNNRLHDVMEWMEAEEVVADDAQVMLGLSLLFLLVCLLNTVGLLLAKFLGKAGDTGLRRALGATRGTLFRQYMIEAGMIGFAGGVMGLFLAWLGLKGVNVLFGSFLDRLVSMDWFMVTTAIALAIVSALLAGIYPTWKACSVAPAGQLKTQ